MDELINRNIFIVLIGNIVLTLLLVGIIGKTYTTDQQSRIKKHIDNRNKELIEVINKSDSLNKATYHYIINKFEQWEKIQKKR